MSEMPAPWEGRIPDWDWSSVSESLLGDSGPWVWSLPFAWHAFADPDGPWVAPTGQGQPGADELAIRIAYWTPLLTLTLGALGWVRPDLGVRRWLEAGRPCEKGQNALRVLDRWWGDNVGGLEEWTAKGGALPSHAEQVNQRVGGAPTRDWRPEAPSRIQWPELTAENLHLGHVIDHLCHERPVQGRLIRQRADSASRTAVLTLETYAGWYAALADHGATLPARPDGRSWRVDVVVKPIGWLGTYRLSRVTGRWFTGRHRWHMLGWNGPAE